MEVKKNLWKFNAIQYIIQSIFFLPVFVVFLQENGLSLTEVFILQAIFAAIVFLLEIPSGFIADIFGRKTSLIMGAVSTTIGLITYSIGNSFLEFIIAEMFWGMGLAFISGSESALLYDSLLELKKEKEYQKREGMGFFYGRIGALISSIVGAFAASKFIRLPFYIMIPFFFILILICISLKEPKRKKKIYKKDYFKKFRKIIKFALIENKEVRWLLIYGGIIEGFSCVVFWLIQPYMKELSIPLFFFGIFYGVLQLFTAIVARYAYIIERKIGKKNSLLILGIFLSIPPIILGLFFNKISLILILFLEFAWVFNIPVMKSYINKIVYSDKRATVISLYSFIARLIMIIFSPIAGLIADKSSVSAAYLTIGIISLIICSVSLYFLKKDKVI